MDRAVRKLLSVRDDEPIKVVARELGLARNTVRKYVRTIVAPQPKPRKRGHLLDAYQADIDALLRPHPRITAVRIGSLLREKSHPNLHVEESTLRRYVASCRRCCAGYLQGDAHSVAPRLDHVARMACPVGSALIWVAQEIAPHIGVFARLSAMNGSFEACTHCSLHGAGLGRSLSLPFSSRIPKWTPFRNSKILASNNAQSHKQNGKQWPLAEI